MWTPFCLNLIGNFKPWEENYLHAYKMKSPLDRTFLPHIHRQYDFNVWSTKIQENKQLPVTIFEAGDVKKSTEKEIEK